MLSQGIYQEENDVLRLSFRIGHWQSKLDAEGNQVGLYADKMMDELLGTHPHMAPEERLEFYAAHIYPDDVEIIQEYTRQMQQNLTEIEYRYFHPTLGLRMVRCQGKTTFDDHGMPVVYGMHQDVTESVRLHYQSEIQDRILAQLTQRLYGFNLTVDLMTGHFTLIPGTGMDEVVKVHQKYPDYNTAQLELSKSVDPEYRKAFFDLVAIEQLRRKAKKTGLIGSLEFPVYYPETDEHHWHELIVFSEANEHGIQVVNVLGRDVTIAHEKAEAEAKLVEEQAANKAKSNFLFNMSHDIRTPMNAIMGFTDLLDKHLDDKELAHSYIKKIQTSNDFLLSLINNVLEMARIESGKATLDETVLNSKEFNDTIYAVFDVQMKEKGITFNRNINIQHQNVYCDETKLREIFLNILSNAYKYTHKGGSVTMDITEIPSEKPGYAIYRSIIQDTGIGMAADFLPHLFEEFVRERNSTESKIHGTGLGMPIVKNLVELMHGTIEVESEVGKGTTFTITIPHRIAKDDELAHKEADAPIDDTLLQGKRILLAEDNALNAEIAVAILQELGIEVEVASDGIACVDKHAHSPMGYYDAILMDIQMPQLNGYDATRRIRKMLDTEKANIPIIAMTANAFEEDKINAIEAGMNDHLSKPIEINKLISTLVRILK